MADQNHAVPTRKSSSAPQDPHHSLPDEELVHAARRGEKRAFVEIVARHQAMVCGIALGILGDFSSSEDAGQEAFLTAWRKFHELREPTRLRPWLAQIARNTALGHLRRQRGHDALEDNPGLLDEAPSPDELIASEEEAALVRQALEKLPELHRLPLILFYREGQSVRAVAEALGISEDAVKQRLARGREMLRDQMSGLVEIVLRGTKPNAIFTMSIAVAIGALAAPAAMAASAFTAASAGAATTTTASTSGILTAMSTSKAILVTAVLVASACAPIGYYIHEAVAPSPIPAAKPVEAPISEPELATSRNPFEGSELFATWRELHDRYGTNSEAMPLIYKAIADFKDPFRRGAFRSALIAEWAQVDPSGGFKFFLGKGPDSDQRRQFFEEWLARDPRGAVKALLAGDSGWEKIAWPCLKQIARVMPESVPEISSRLPKNESYWDTSVSDAFTILMENNPGKARKAAEAMTGPNREQALCGVAQAWAKNDLPGAMAWAKALPEGTDRDEVIRSALMGRASVNPVEALDLIGTVPSGGRHAYFATTTGARVLTEAVKADFDATVAWVVAHPGRVGREDMFGLAGAVTDRLNADAVQFLDRHAADGSLKALLPAVSSALLNRGAGQRAAVWEWLKNQPDNEVSSALRQEVLSSAGYQDPELAVRFAADLPSSPQGNALMKTVTDSLMNGGSMLHRFDKLYEEAPERLRQPLLESAFRLMRSEYLSAPQPWVERLSLLSGSSRTKATESLARAWGEQMPEEAIGWAASLAPGESRNSAFAGVSLAWAAKDAHGAAEWVGSLPPGAERDRSAESLVLAVADKFPQEAWNWASSINDSEAKARAASHVIKLMAKRDAATARNWLENGSFTAEARAELQAVLGGAKPGSK